MAPAGKKLEALAASVGGSVASSDSDVLVTDVVHDSRQVTPGSMFVALRGDSFDGHAYLESALAAGASAVCVDHPTGVQPSLVVQDTRSVLGTLAAEVHDHPSSKLKLVGVTGTNGKTTVTHYLHSIYAKTGRVAGLIGTVKTVIGGVERSSIRTTPEATDFQRVLAEMVDSDVTHVAAEVSSHALELGRVRATQFAVTAFTNLSQDHLDFHGDMKSYRASKERLFAEYESQRAVLNIDDPVGAEMTALVDAPVLTVGRGGDIEIRRRATDSAGSAIHLQTPDGDAELLVPVLGGFNLANLGIAVGCALASGLEFTEIVPALTELETVPGRFEKISGSDPVMVIVDYAHTPTGIDQAIAAARDIAPGRVVALAGAGGDRDRDKRPQMGAALAKADRAIVTSDNPRSEDPAVIVADVVSGAGDTAQAVVDRRTAIEQAIAQGEPGDVVLILGRGHEPFQDLGEESIPFDDRLVAREILSTLRGEISK